MNQMMGHAATAMSEMFKEKMDMTPPDVKFVTLKKKWNIWESQWKWMNSFKLRST